jgi:hypothetical protein
MDDPIATAIDRWRNAGVRLKPPANAEILEALARFIGGDLPADLARFYRLANGMADYETDDHNVSFWSIERVLTENDIRSSADDGGPCREVAFGDWMIESWRFYARVRGDEVVGVSAEGGGPKASSLAEFFRLYLSEPCPYPV